ncbi:nucleotidyltransferase family protein [Saccharicrinis sp. FJH62]|uniref:nucleotidyltransferase family protein n=1 Tax=Saccharicrinis sp. FJH62 TaxID=3344657 RepID=UPI0035D41870
MMTKEAIILAGGLGTRLKDVISDIPKPMAKVAGKPFLEYIFRYLNRFDIQRIILSVGYKYEVINEQFGDSFLGMKLVYAVEEEPLGTGGGILNALNHVISKEVFLINGDTFFDVDLGTLESHFLSQKYDLCFALKPMNNFDRYGEVIVAGDKVVGFNEKKMVKEGLINGGIYILRSDIFDGCGLTGKFSFETDYLAEYKDIHTFGYIISDTYFIDIGIPEDYNRAHKQIPLLF